MSGVSPKLLAEHDAKLRAFFDAHARNGLGDVATFVNTPEQLYAAGIIDAEASAKLIAERDGGTKE